MLEHIVKDLDSVDEKYRDLYKEVDGGFEIEVKGVSEMKRAKTREKERAQDAEDKSRDLQGRLDALENKNADDDNKRNKKAGDIDALERSWQKKLDDAVAEKDVTISSQGASIQKMLVDNEAIKMASELAIEGSAGVLLPHIKSRLAAESRDGELRTVVLDADGKPSALTLTELKEEFSNDKAYGAIIVGSKASGSGAAGATGGGAATKGNAGGSKEDRAKYFASKHPELAQNS